MIRAHVITIQRFTIGKLHQDRMTVKSDLLLLVEYGPDGRPSAFKVAEDKLRELVQQACQNRSLTESYLDWDIAQKSNKSQSSRQVRSQAVFKRWV